MDVLANMLITIKNGYTAGHETVHIPYSQFKADVAKALLGAGYIASYQKRDRNKGSDILEVALKTQENGDVSVHDVKRISKPSRRLYAGVQDIYEVKQGHGTLFLSTPKGVLTGDQARKEQVGGELLFEIW